MNLRRNLLAAFLCAPLVSLSVPVAGLSQVPFKEPITNVVLVHGAWADGSSWLKLLPLLEAKGLHVVCVQIPLTSFAEDVAATKRIIDAQGGPVLLVGHSYGGAVITEAGNDPKVAGLVYVAAFAPDQGESAGSLGKPYGATPGVGELRPLSDGFLVLTEKGILEDFAPDVAPCRPYVDDCDPSPNARCCLGSTHHNCCLAHKALMVCCGCKRSNDRTRTGTSNG